MKTGKKIIAVRASDGHKIKFDSVNQVSEFAGVAASSISHRLKTGSIDRNGYYYIVDDNTELTDGQIKYRKYKQGKRTATYKNDDAVLDRDTYKIVKYEVRNLRESITPCPFKCNPKPMVGGGYCVRCGSFKGRNKVTHEVACSRNCI